MNFGPSDWFANKNTLRVLYLRLSTDKQSVEDKKQSDSCGPIFIPAIEGGIIGTFYFCRLIKSSGNTAE